MLLPVQHLLDRLRHPRSRADELRTLRGRLMRQPDDAQATAGEVALARALRAKKEALSRALGEVRACSGCARRHPLPHGRWDGGHCCGGRTDGVFTDDELAALRLSGTSPARLRAPEGDHAGCVFRGPRGCSLEVADRPAICVRYVCRELEDELRARGDAGELKRAAAEIGALQERFSRLRAPRLAKDEEG